VCLGVCVFVCLCVGGGGLHARMQTFVVGDVNENSKKLVKTSQDKKLLYVYACVCVCCGRVCRRLWWATWLRTAKKKLLTIVHFLCACAACAFADVCGERRG